MKPTEPTAGRANRLASEASPYLLQHAANPVDWYPWGDEAFAKSHQEHKPIFLSIGYSTCHWCHVMERESFEDLEIANFLNAHFVSIKVDREERPDVDRIYMTFVQAFTGSGGWPLSVFLTPDRKPFYGGTYWPPKEKYGRPGFLTVLQQVHAAWQQRQPQILASAEEMHSRLAQVMGRNHTRSDRPELELLRQAGAALKQNYDPVHGGWGTAPKFPMPSHPAFLLRYGVRFQDREAVEMLLHTCRRMARGGLYDQLGGGFHRYSVDERWLVPHFEKMLYDNAQLLSLFLDCHLVSGEPFFADVARGVANYVLRDLTHPEGGFYSAEDADSEGKEGKFYCWTRAELSRLLTVEEFNVFVRYFGVTETGNFVDHSDPDPLPCLNVLSVVAPECPSADKPLLESAHAKLLQERARRVRPLRDDKVLASWNGLMLGALARAYAVLGEDAYLTAARSNLAFLRAKLWDPGTRTLHHRWRDGRRDSVQLLEAYAFLLAGTLDLYEVTLDASPLEFALELATGLLARFHDAAAGGFWQSGLDANDLILRVKEDYDGALPSGNSVAALSLLRLAAITGRTELRQPAEQILKLLADRLQQLPASVTHLLSALDFASQEPLRVVIAAGGDDARARRLLRAAHGVYRPAKVVLGTAGPVESLARSLTSTDGQATAFVCTGTACQPPTSDPDQLRALLQPSVTGC